MLPCSSIATRRAAAFACLLAACSDAGDAPSDEPTDGALQPLLDAELHPAELEAGLLEGGSMLDAAAPDASQPLCRTGNVDLLFVVDNSGSMAEEQAKLARVMPELLAVLTTGNRDGKLRADGSSDFPPADSIHIGVVTTDMSVALAPAVDSCGALSFDPTARDPQNPSSTEPLDRARLIKPFGDDGLLQTSTQVATTGIWTRPYRASLSTPQQLAVEPDPSCAELSTEQPYLTYQAGASLEQLAHHFSCIAKRGKNGCGLEQQLEAMLKALTPAESPLKFSQDSSGHGSAPGRNAGFLRDDAVLTIVHVSDEDDCSIPDSSSELFALQSSQFPQNINLRCAIPENQLSLHGIERYVSGLRALKSPEHRERIVLAGLVGVPLPPLQTEGTYAGVDQLSALLAAPEMQYDGAFSNLEVKPVCSSASGSAAPGRRFVDLARHFGDNGLVTSICADSYASTVQRVGERISKYLSVHTCVPPGVDPTADGGVLPEAGAVLDAGGAGGELPDATIVLK